jgi:polyisoprenoid-binding protein YceI
MKKIKLTFIALSAFLILNQSAFAKENKYVIEPNHTSISWIANHFGFSNVSGKFTDVQGNILFDEKNPEKSAVDVNIKIASINTGLPKFDQHLKSKDFFDAEAFPTAKFVSKKIIVSGKNKAKIEGDLTLLGITKSVVLNVKFNKAGLNPINQKQSIGFSATTTINRSDFGIKYALPAVADKIDLIIEAEANQ